MPHRRMTVALFSGLLAAPLFAQTQIGGGVCNSSTLKGNFEIAISGRQVNSAATYTGVFQANGAANFDGQSKVTMTLAADNLQTSGTPLNWSGTYTMQANCTGTIQITSGGTATFNLAVYNQGNDFLLVGNDAGNFYSGSGDSQPASCSTSALSGPYAFSGTGFFMNNNVVQGAGDVTGLLQFDGAGKFTGSDTVVANGPSQTGTFSGTYTVNSNCLGTATFTDSQGHADNTVSFSVSNATSSAITDASIVTGRPAKQTFSGAIHTLAGLSCSAATLNGTYSLSFNGRNISPAGAVSGYFQSDGTIVFDGNGNVTLTGTSNSDKGTGKPFNYSGTYTMPSNCLGSMTISAAGGSASMTLVPWNGGKQFNFTGNDNSYVYSGSGFNVRPAACSVATLSGAYSYSSTGLLSSGSSITGTVDESGVLLFDGAGNVTAAYTSYAPAKSAPFTATGTYSVTSGCTGTATLTDSSNVTNTLTFSLQNTYAQGGDLIESSSQYVRTGSMHPAFVNPTQAIGNVASYQVNATPPGSVFVIFGQNLATRGVGASNVPLPTTLLNTSVTVNGEAAPLFYVDTGQIDAQMPWDIPGGALATVVVKNGTSTSNAAAVFVPATGTPGISVYGNNRAVVVNANGSVNAGDAPAKVGDIVVAYFTGGGPVNTSGKLTSGAASPGGLSPVTGNTSITVGTANATVQYIGLTPGGIGLYQANFTVPQVAAGTYPLKITIAGQASNTPVMTVAN